MSTFEIPSDLRRLISEGKISEDGVATIARLNPDALRKFLEQDGRSAVGVVSITSDKPPLSDEATWRVIVLTGNLTTGMDVENDARLTAILEGLTITFPLTIENLSRLTGISAADFEQALIDPKLIPIATKYDMAIKASYIFSTLQQARGE